MRWRPARPRLALDPRARARATRDRGTRPLQSVCRAKRAAPHASRRSRPRSGRGTSVLLLLVDPGADVVRALARAKLDDPEFREAGFHVRIVLHDRLDLGACLARCDDDAAVARYLAPGNDERPRRVMLLEERHVRAHLRIDRGELGLVDQLDDEHGYGARWTGRP